MLGYILQKFDPKKCVCRICGKEIKYDCKFITFGNRIKGRVYDDDCHIQSIDLCENCNEKIIDYINKLINHKTYEYEIQKEIEKRTKNVIKKMVDKEMENIKQEMIEKFKEG